MKTQKAYYKYTDTFGGEPNYSWVKHGPVEAKTKLGLIRKAKAAAGISGVACKRDSWGDTIELRPYGSATVLFIIGV